jgi:hypothetical protein
MLKDQRCMHHVHRVKPQSICSEIHAMQIQVECCLVTAEGFIQLMGIEVHPDNALRDLRIYPDQAISPRHAQHRNGRGPTEGEGHLEKVRQFVKLPDFG